MMEVEYDVFAGTAISSEPLNTCSSDDMLIEQDGDYIISDEKHLPFEHKKVLGKGWSAVVEKVQDKRTKETYAKKVINFPRLKAKNREKSEQLYRNEVAIIRNLQFHRHVIELFATYTTPRSGGLILRPAADQGDLQSFLDQYADAAEGSATDNDDLKGMNETLERAFGCLSSGLSYMHKKGIRHKDIKPGNILIHQGVVIYTDFGASKDTKADGQCTTEGRPESLTRRYCAPEVLEHDKRNFAADIFSLGCVFVEILLRLSGLTEYDDLEEDGYSGVMDVLHELLRSAKVQPKLSFLLDIVIPMTAREPLGRPASEEVVASICYHAGFSCSHCARVRPEEHAIHAQQPTWNAEYQRYFYTWWDGSNKLWYRTHYVEGQGWVFFDWLPEQPLSPDTRARNDSGYIGAHSAGSANLFSREGKTVMGSYNTSNPMSHEPLDTSFQVRHRDYFIEGRMFAILFAEAAGSNAVTDYNTDLSLLTRVKHGELVRAQVRRFIVVKRKREFCYAVPVFTYGNRATTKPGVRPDEHAIAYSYGYNPCLVPGEIELQKYPIAIVNNSEKPLSVASRIYFGIHHPIQYNVKAKDLGYVHPDFMATFSGYWKMESGHAPEQGLEVTYDPTNHDTN